MIIEKNINIIDYINNKLKNKENIIVAHCISNDWALGKGIAKSLDKEFNIKKNFYKNSKKTNLCDSVYVDVGFPLYNLITKEHYWGKPTYNTMKNTLLNFKKSILIHNLKNYELIVPRIGCGLDRLNWDKVKLLIEDILIDLIPDITVCYL